MEESRGSGNGARLATAAANIARGAATGGLAGATVAAAESFMPELIKLAFGLLILFIMLPFLIFAALPNILFGFSSSTADNVVAMTEKAAIIDNAYLTIDAETRRRVDKIVKQAQEQYTDSEGPRFDELEVQTATDNTNLYWFIAINSVEHQQDLFSMSTESIRTLIVSKIVWNCSLITRPIGTGESTGMIRLLRVDINDLDPNALMDKLGFTEEERNWARVLYSTLTDEQWVDTGGVGGGLDLSDFEFTDVTTPVVYFNQLDSRWCNTLYGRTGTIGEEGCGPTALAIVVSSFTSRYVTPVDVAKWAVSAGQRCEGNGSYQTIIVEGARHYGLKAEGIGRDERKLVEALSEGKLVVALMGKGHFTRGGHFIVLRGITSNGQILVADPSSTKRSNQAWAPSIFTLEAKKGASANGPFWVISK